MIPFVYRPAAPDLKADLSESQADKELNAVASLPFVGIYEASTFASSFHDQMGERSKGPVVIFGTEIRYSDPHFSGQWTFMCR